MSVGYQVRYDIKTTACNSFGHTNKAPRLQQSVMSLEWSWNCEVYTCPKA